MDGKDHENAGLGTFGLFIEKLGEEGKDAGATTLGPMLHLLVLVLVLVLVRAGWTLTLISLPLLQGSRKGSNAL